METRFSGWIGQYPLQIRFWSPESDARVLFGGGRAAPRGAQAGWVATRGHASHTPSAAISLGNSTILSTRLRL